MGAADRYSVRDYADSHLCDRCGAKASAHAVKNNACPPIGRASPKWPTSIKDDDRAGKVYDARLAKFWAASKGTFLPR